jgi:hypothetical protein
MQGVSDGLRCERRRLGQVPEAVKAAKMSLGVAVEILTGPVMTACGEIARPLLVCVQTPRRG